MSSEKIKDVLSNRMADDSSNRHSHIGLAIVRNIIKNHRGKMNIFSQPGVGTAVEIILPPK
jgi:signal transduction histidine kinase